MHLPMKSASLCRQVCSRENNIAVRQLASQTIIHILSRSTPFLDSNGEAVNAWHCLSSFTCPTPDKCFIITKGTIVILNILSLSPTVFQCCRDLDRIFHHCRGIHSAANTHTASSVFKLSRLQDHEKLRQDCSYRQMNRQVHRTQPKFDLT